MSQNTYLKLQAKGTVSYARATWWIALATCVGTGAPIVKAYFQQPETRPAQQVAANEKEKIDKLERELKLVTADLEKVGVNNLKLLERIQRLEHSIETLDVENAALRADKKRLEREASDLRERVVQAEREREARERTDREREARERAEREAREREARERAEREARERAAREATCPRLTLKSNCGTFYLFPSSSKIKLTKPVENLHEGTLRYVGLTDDGTYWCFETVERQGLLWYIESDRRGSTSRAVFHQRPVREQQATEYCRFLIPAPTLVVNGGWAAVNQPSIRPGAINR